MNSFEHSPLRTETVTSYVPALKPTSRRTSVFITAGVLASIVSALPGPTAFAQRGVAPRPTTTKPTPKSTSAARTKAAPKPKTKPIGKAPAKVQAKAPAKSTPKIQASTRPRATLPPQPKNVQEKAVTETWTVSKSLEGWGRIDDQSWPESGRALVIEGRADSLEVRQAPNVGAPGLLFAKGRSSTGPVTFLAVRDYGEWVQVLLPVRPNGTTGWVRGREVSRIAVTHRIVVNLSTNTMLIENNGVVEAEYPVSTGTGGTPTPTGLFYVRELVVQAQADGPYGPFVFGLSGYSDVLNSFAGGEGAIGIHGTNRPEAIGENVSYGCVRLTNETILAVSKTLPLGTPVEIVRSLVDLPTKRRAMAEPDADPVLPVAAGGIVIDFPLEPSPVPERKPDDSEVVELNPPSTPANTPANLTPAATENTQSGSATNAVV
jgi:lipoprotein-anchoring transpeptidase ErfK/SrfK